MRNYSDPAYKQFRMDVLKRDKFNCKMCKASGKRKKMYVHHIRKWANAASLRYETSNGITLCYNCHKEVTGKEEHYEYYLLGLLEN
jgi:5-methylcytosine-specific restriction endonuclease McrA